MRAILLSEFGPPERLVPTSVDEPVPAAGEVLVDVEAANVTFVDTQLRAGRPPNPRLALELPAVPGNGVGGRIAAVGPGVDEALVGLRVVTATGGSGGYAERAVAPAATAVPVPDAVALDDAVALLADGRTALLLMRTAQVAPGETVLVEAAAGGVGSLLVQLAKAAGARVVAAAGSERKLAVARELGADAGVDYTRPAWTEDAGPVDVVFDAVGGDVGRAAFGLVRPGGRYVPFGAASGGFAGVTADDAAAAGVTIATGSPPTPEATAALVAEALEAAAAGRLRPLIGQRHPLERAADAHRAIEARETIGKTLLVVR